MRSKQPIVSEEALLSAFARLRSRRPTADEVDSYRRNFALWRANQRPTPSEAPQPASGSLLFGRAGSVHPASTRGISPARVAGLAALGSLAAVGVTIGILARSAAPTPAASSGTSAAAAPRALSPALEPRQPRSGPDAGPMSGPQRPPAARPQPSPRSLGAPQQTPPSSDAHRPAASRRSAFEIIERAELLSRRGQASKARLALESLPPEGLTERDRERAAALRLTVGCQLGREPRGGLLEFAHAWGAASRFRQRICQACACDQLPRVAAAPAPRLGR